MQDAALYAQRRTVAARFDTAGEEPEVYRRTYLSEFYQRKQHSCAGTALVFYQDALRDWGRMG